MSIELKLQAILETKAALQAALNLPNSVPFSQYAGRINWKDETPPSDLLFADYTKDRYSVSGVPVGFSDVNEFTRLSSATKLQDGQLAEVAANVPRISGEGLLVEEQRTNRMTWSNDFTRFSTDKLTAAPNMITDSVSPSPVLMRCYRSRVLAEGETNTCTIEAKAGTRHGIFLEAADGGTSDRVKVNLLTGEIIYVNAAVKATILPAGEGWWRISITRPQPASSNPVFLSFCFGFCSPVGPSVLTEGDGTGTIYVRRSQVEVGTFPTSYIPTKGSAVTRTTDTLNIPLLPSQTFSGDWDAGVTYTVAGGIATFTGHGYIRNITVEAL